MKLGVAISTRNRRDIFTFTIDQWRKRLPAGAELVVVDDASDDPLAPIDGVTIIRHDHRRGVATTKNRGIAELTDRDCTDLFLADDDVYPKIVDWWRPYVESPEHHLMYGWPRPGRNSKWREVYRDERHFAIGFPRGVLLYMDRHCIDAIGGMDPGYGARGEHVEYSYRAWLAGMSSFTQVDETGQTVAAYGDVVGSDRIWHALDQHRRIKSSFGDVATMRRLDLEAGRNWGCNWPNGKPAYFDPQTGERIDDTSRERATTVHYCHFVPTHPPHRWSCYDNTPGEGEMLCLGWHGRPDRYSPDANLDDLPEDRNYSTGWFDVSSAATWDMFLPARIENALEIGSFEGRSANWLLTNRDVGHLTCVDPFTLNDDPCSDAGDYSARFDRNVTARFSQVAKVTGFSPVAVPAGRYDFIYIDGEHSYESTIADLEKCWSMLTVGGLMIVDDIAFWPYEYGALRATEDFFAERPHRVVFTGYQLGVCK